MLSRGGEAHWASVRAAPLLSSYISLLVTISLTLHVTGSYRWPQPQLGHFLRQSVRAFNNFNWLSDYSSLQLVFVLCGKLLPTSSLKCYRTSLMPFSHMRFIMFPTQYILRNDHTLLWYCGRDSNRTTGDWNTSNMSNVLKGENKLKHSPLVLRLLKWPWSRRQLNRNPKKNILNMGLSYKRNKLKLAQSLQTPGMWKPVYLDL